VNALDSRDIDILTAMAQIAMLEQSLNFMQAKLSTSKQADPTTETLINRICQLVRYKLKAVLDLVQDLRNEPSDGTRQTSRFRAMGKRAIYPFKKEGLKKLQSELRDLNGILNGALRPLDEYVTIRMMRSFTGGN
jgi:hypothetical protein